MARLSAVEKVARDRRVVADRMRGLTWLTLAERYGIDERTARSIVKQHREAEVEGLVYDPVEAARELVAAQEAVIEGLVLTAESASSDTVRVSALRACSLAV